MKKLGNSGINSGILGNSGINSSHIKLVGKQPAE